MQLILNAPMFAYRVGKLLYRCQGRNIIQAFNDSVYMRSGQNRQPNSDAPDMNSRKER